MAKRERPIVNERRSEDVIIPPGETANWILLSDADVDALAAGWVSEELSERMWRLKGDERRTRRVEAQEKAAS